MGPVAVNWSVHTACKQHQRICVPLCMCVASRVLCELGLNILCWHGWDRQIFEWQFWYPLHWPQRCYGLWPTHALFSHACTASWPQIGLISCLVSVWVPPQLVTPVFFWTLLTSRDFNPKQEKLHQFPLGKEFISWTKWKSIFRFPQIHCGKVLCL